MAMSLADTSSRNRRAEWAALTPEQRAARLAPAQAARRRNRREIAKKISVSVASYWASITSEERAELGLLMSAGNRERWTRPGERERNSVAQKQRFTDPEERRKDSEAIRRVWQDPSRADSQNRSRDGLVKGTASRWADPEQRERASVKTRERMSRLYRDPAWVKKWVQSFIVKPNRAEVVVLAFLNELGLGRWKFNTERTVGRKIPDFLRTDRKRVAVDLFGDYWHRGDSARKRQAIFRAHGWRLVVIWHSEFTRDPMLLERRLRRALREHKKARR